MASPQKEKGHSPIANELLQAMIRNQDINLAGRILLWVIRNTYGWSRKTCAFSWTKIAKDVRSERKIVSRSGRKLIACNMLLVDEKKRIGIQKDYETWAKWPASSEPQGLLSSATAQPLPPRPRSPGPQVPLAPHFSTRSPYARAKQAVKQEVKAKGKASGPVGPRTAPSLPTLPNHKPDTIRNRIDLGSWVHDPQDHPDWSRSEFETRHERIAEWQYNCKDNDQRKLEAQREAGRKKGLYPS